MSKRLDDLLSGGWLDIPTIRAYVESIEEERDEAIAERDAAKLELQEVLRMEGERS